MCSVPPCQQDYQKKSKDDFLDQPLPPLSLFEMARTRLGLAKAQSAQTADLATDILENRGCLVVFTAHHDAADHLATHLGKHWKTVVVDGRTPASKRTGIIKSFQNGEIDCLIAGMDAAGEGINLHRADTCLFLEMALKPSTLSQASSRLHRDGQKSTVHAIYLVADNPVDRLFRDLCLEKADLVGGVLEEEVRVLGDSRGSVKSESVPELEHELEHTPVAPHGDGITEMPNRRNLSEVEVTAHGEKYTPNRKTTPKKKKYGRSLSAEERLEKLAVKQEQTEDRLMEALDRIRHLDEENVTDNEEPLQDAAKTLNAVEVTEHRDEKVTDCETDVTDARELKKTELREKQVTDGETEITGITGGPTTANKKRRAAQWERQHPEKVKQQTAARAKRYRERHPEKHKEGLKAYRQEHKAESRAYMREYRKDNEDLKAKHREYMRAWRARQKASAGNHAAHSVEVEGA